MWAIVAEDESHYDRLRAYVRSQAGVSEAPGSLTDVSMMLLDFGGRLHGGRWSVDDVVATARLMTSLSEGLTSLHQLGRSDDAALIAATVYAEWAQVGAGGILVLRDEDDPESVFAFVCGFDCGGESCPNHEPYLLLVTEGD